MADFCLDCFNQINASDYGREDVILEYGLCEGCGQYKKVVVDLVRPFGLFATLYRILIRLQTKLHKNEP